MASSSFGDISATFPSSFCLPVTVDLLQDSFSVHTLWIGIAFLLGFLLGCLIAGLLVRPCLREYAKKKNEDERDVLLENAGISPLEYRVLTSSHDNRPDVIKDLPPGMIIGRDADKDHSGSGDGTDETDAGTRRGMADILVQTNSELADAEMMSQDVDNIDHLDVDFKQERQMAFLKLLSMYLNKKKEADDLTPNFCDNFLRKVEQDMKYISRASEQEKHDDLQELLNSSAYKNDPSSQQSAVCWTNERHSQKLNKQLNEYMGQVRQDLCMSSPLTEQQVDALMDKLWQNMASVEQRLTSEQARHREALEDRLARRRQLLQSEQLERKASVQGLNETRDSLATTLTEAVKSGTLTNKQCEEIMAKYDEDLKRLNDLMNSETQRHQVNLAAELQRRRLQNLRKLNTKQEKETSQFLAGVNKGVNTATFVQQYDELIQQQREETERLTGDMDETDAAEFAKVRNEQTRDWDKRLHDIENTTRAGLAKLGGVSEGDIDRIMAMYRQQADKCQKLRAKQKKKQQLRLQEQLAQRRQLSDEEQQLQMAEEEVLWQQQEVTIKNALESNMDLDEAARDKIFEEHQRNTQQLNNQRQLSRLKQRKNLERILSERRARLCELREKKEEMNTPLSVVSEKDRHKVGKQLDAQIGAEEAAFEAERLAAIVALQRHLIMETEALLREQDEQLGVMIGKLQVGQARRQAVLQRQDKTLQELQEQLEKRVTEGGQLPRNETDQIIQQHYNRVAYLNDQVRLNKEKQESMLRERLQAKQLRKQREIENEIRQEAHDEFYKQKKNKKNSVALSIMQKMLLEQRHAKLVEDMEREVSLDNERQRQKMNEELELEMQRELEEQRKQFLTQLAAVSNLSEGDLNHLVDSAISNKGKDDKSAKILAKNLREDMRRAKTSLGMHDESEEDEVDGARPAYRRTRTDLEPRGLDRQPTRGSKKKKQSRRTKVAFGES